MIAGVTVATGKQIWSGMHQTLQHISDALRAKKHGYAEIHKKTFTHELTTMLRIYLHDGNAENYQKIGMVPHEEKLQYTFDRKVLKSGTVGELNIDLNNFSKMLVKAPELINATGKDQQVVIGVLDKFIKSYNDDMDKIDINDTAKYENIKQVKDQLTFARSVILVYGNVATTWVNELTSIGSKTRLDKNIVDV